MLMRAKDKKSSVIEALNRSQAVIEFTPEGIILTANENFLSTMQYELHEIVGQHHSQFVDTIQRESAAYQSFWQELAEGTFKQGEFKRIKKNGDVIWLQATYNPILDSKGRVEKVVKFASDITADKLKNAYFQGQIDAISKSQAVIEFDPQGNILHANENFLGAMGYSLDELKGRHHSLFVEPAYGESEDYKQFWLDLADGAFKSGQFKRFAKSGSEVWIQASYNPIFDMDGDVFKVVKFATDITAEKLKNADFEGQIEAIHKSQAVIEFNLDGIIQDANDNFLAVMGYSLNEIKGQHHKIFAPPGYEHTDEYAEFWEKLRQGQFFLGSIDALLRMGAMFGLKQVIIPLSI